MLWKKKGGGGLPPILNKLNIMKKVTLEKENAASFWDIGG
jgi:hypothetical protein